MSKILYIDVNTGEIRTALNSSIAKRLKLYLRDLTPMTIAFHQNGVLTTDAVLENGDAAMKVGIRARPGVGNILALATTYNLAGDEASLVLSLNTVELIDYFAGFVDSNAIESELVLEVEVTSSDDSERVTYFQSSVLIGREVNMSDDTTPTEASAAEASLHTAGESVGSGRFLHILADGTVVYADASTNRPAHGYTKEAVTAGNPVTLWRGLFLNGLSGLTPGTTYYLSDSTPGFYIATPPSAGLVQRLGVADTATVLAVEIEPQMVAIL